MSQESVLPIEEANQLVEENRGWAEGIARAVARAWNMDWQLDGLDGAAMEALLFCSRRFNPERGVPFRGYARKRIHESSTEAARKTRSWKRGIGNESPGELSAREISAELVNLFPELREGTLSFGDESSGDSDFDTRGAIRDLLVSASVLAAKHGMRGTTPEENLDLKKVVEFMASMAVIHQIMLWKIYWETISMRNLAEDWHTDELNVIREHQVLMGFLQKSVGKGAVATLPKVRPGLKKVAERLEQEGEEGPFQRIIAEYYVEQTP